MNALRLLKPHLHPSQIAPKPESSSERRGLHAVFHMKFAQNAAFQLTQIKSSTLLPMAARIFIAMVLICIIHVQCMNIYICMYMYLRIYIQIISILYIIMLVTSIHNVFIIYIYTHIIHCFRIHCLFLSFHNMCFSNIPISS